MVHAGGGLAATSVVLRSGESAEVAGGGPGSGTGLLDGSGR
jgi:hypothetical protein